MVFLDEMAVATDRAFLGEPTDEDLFGKQDE